MNTYAARSARETAVNMSLTSLPWALFAGLAAARWLGAVPPRRPPSIGTAVALAAGAAALGTQAALEPRRHGLRPGESS